jgi:hypothetical protein
MSTQHLRMFLVAGLIAVPIALLSLPGAERPTFIGAAFAQEPLDIDYFYDQLDSYGDWVWHPRFGYVWLPQNVSEDWRPYAVGHWVYTDEYGWYWDSHEPFAWAVYHYGRWGYDRDYGWFWVPGNTWAPAWVEWRYSDKYVGWAPIGPTRAGGYAYGAPVSYDPPVAESWVFVEPRYVTAPSIFEHSVPIPQINVAFMSTGTIYQPDYRAGAVFNFGIPRDTVMRITNDPIVVKKIVRVQNQTNVYEGDEGGIKVFAPSVSNGRTDRTPKRFIDTPSEFKPKAKLTATVEGTPPKGLGPTASTLKPIASEVAPEEFKKHVAHFGNAQDQTPGAAGQASTESATGGPGKPHLKGAPALGGPQAPVGSAGQGQASTENAPGGPSKPNVQSAPALGAQAPIGGATGQGQASTEGAPGGADKPHFHRTPAGGSQTPGAAGQASTESATGGPGKPHLKGAPGLGALQAPVGSAGQGQASTESAPGGPGKPNVQSAPALGAQAPIGATGQGQASTEGAPGGADKPHFHRTPAGGSQAPIGAAGQGQASTESATGGPGKPHLKGAPGLGALQAPVGSAGQGQAPAESAPGSPGKPRLAGAPSSPPTGKHPKRPECVQHPELPVCKDQHQ